MLIDCPSCFKSYPVGRAALGEGGRAVVCVACGTRWFVGGGSPAAETGRLRPAARPDAPRRADPSKRGSMRPVAVASACLLLSMGLIGERVAIVRSLPPTAGLYAAIGLSVNVRGLVFADVRTIRSTDGEDRLAVSGTIRNVAAGAVPMPRITFDIRDGSGTIVSSWSKGAPKPVLARDESVSFQAEMPTLPNDSKDVVVRFGPKAAAPASGLLLGKR